MALTITNVSSQDVGNGQRVVADVLFDNSYPHGGEPLTAADLGMRVGKLEHVDVRSIGGRIFEFEPDATLTDRGKVIARDLVHPRTDYITTKPGVAIGTVDAAEIKITNIVRCVVAAALSVLELAAAEHAFTATTHNIAADADTPQERWFLLETTDGIAVIVTPGAIADEGLAVPPAVTADHAPIGLVKVVVAAGATPFNATTDDLDAAHLTTTFEDLNMQVYQATDLSAVTARVVAYGR